MELTSATSGRSGGEELKAALISELEHAVSIANTSERHQLLGLKRDVFNGRTVQSLFDRSRLPESVLVILDRWIAFQKAEHEHRQRLCEILTHEMVKSKRVLAKLAVDGSCGLGLQLSGRTLWNSAKKYSKDNSAKHNSKLEDSLVSYLFRSSLKCSPFGAFAEVGAFDRFYVANSLMSGQKTHPRISRMLLCWMERQLTLDRDCRLRQQIRLNNTIRITANQIEFFTRGDDGTEAMFGEEKLVVLTCSRALTLIITEVSENRVSSVEHLIHSLSLRGISKPQAETYVESLVTIGLLERDLGIPDQLNTYALEMAVRLSDMGKKVPEKVARLLMNLVDIESAFSTFDIDARERLLEKFDTAVNEFSIIINTPAPDVNDARTHIFEDVGTTDSPSSWNSELLNSQFENFVSLQHFLPLFDDAIVERLGLYELFSKIYGKHGRCNDLLDFYAVFAKQNSSDVTSSMLGVNEPDVQAIRELRREFLDYLQAQVNDLGSETCVSLESSDLRSFVSRYPSSVTPWVSASYAFQFNRSTDIIFNRVATGCGTQSARFRHLLEELSIETADFDPAFPGLIDITAVLGLNTNLHPPLTTSTIEYPRSRAILSGQEVLSLRDIFLVGDPQAKRIRTYCRRTGNEVSILPFNSLFPAAGPNLYRFMCVLSPALINVRLQLCQRLFQRSSMKNNWQYPRFKLGSIVLDRQSWFVEPENLRLRNRSGLDSFRIIERGRACMAKFALPNDAFFRFISSQQMESSDWIEEMRTWAITARRSRLRKPHYIDFRNPFLLRVLFKQVEEMDSQLVMFQESLPETLCYQEPINWPSAEEFIVELRQVRA